jgi:flagella basal body P-ring formation protein FlgA
MHILPIFHGKMKLTLLSVILGTLLLLGPSHAEPGSSGARVTLKPSARVKENTVKLGHIAEIRGADAELTARLKSLTIMPAPALGQNSVVSMETIREILMQRTWSRQVLLDGAPRTEISRACLRISAERLEDIGREYIEKHMPWGKGQARIINVMTDEAIVPEADLSFKVTAQPNEDFLGDVSLIITISDRSKTLKQVWWRGEVVVPTEIVVADRFLKRGQIISEKDVTTRAGTLDDDAKNAIMNVSSVIGKKIKKDIRPGQAVRTDYLIEPPAVRKGDVVTVVAESRLLKVTAQGVARENGCPGDSIRVMNLASKKEIIGQVEGPALIKVAY